MKQFQNNFFNSDENLQVSFWPKKIPQLKLLYKYQTAIVRSQEIVEIRHWPKCLGNCRYLLQEDLYEHNFNPDHC